MQNLYSGKWPTELELPLTCSLRKKTKNQNKTEKTNPTTKENKTKQKNTPKRKYLGYPLVHLTHYIFQQGLQEGNQGKGAIFMRKIMNANSIDSNYYRDEPVQKILQLSLLPII